MDSPEVNPESCRGRCEAAGEDDDTGSRNRRRWWRRFSPAAVCNRMQKKDGQENSEKQRDVPPEGALQDTGENTEGDRKGTKGKRRFHMRVWPTFKGSRALTEVRRTREQKRDFGDVNKPSLTFKKKMLNIFIRGGKNRSPRVPQENLEDKRKCEEAQWSPVAQVDTPAELDVTGESPEVVTVVVQMSVQLTESLDQTATEEQLVTDVTVTEDNCTNRSEPVQTEPTLPVEDLMEAASPEKDEVVCDSIRVIPDAAGQSSTSTSSWLESSEVEETVKDATSRSLQPSTNGPSIRIELVPPDDDSQEDEEEEEECWEASSSSENHLFLLLGFERSEWQLLQTARSLVRTAVNAAMDQLTREQQSNSDCVHRELLGYRDHA